MPHLQLEFPPKCQGLFRPARYKVIYGGRGKGASWSMARALLVKGTEQPLRIGCARETQNSIAESVHQLLEEQVTRLGLDHLYKVEKARILGTNGTEFFFLGLKHNPAGIKSLEGADILWVEEAENVSKDSWKVVVPTIRKPGSEIWVNFNPKRSTDETYVRFVVNTPPDCWLMKMSYLDNPWFSDTTMPAELEHLRTTDYAEYLHVWEGECVAHVEGAIYADEIKAARAEGRVCDVPHDPRHPVNTFWDLGFGDRNAIWFVQAVNGWFHCIDYLSANGKTIAWYVQQLQQRPYVYGVDWLPHDGVDAIIHSKLSGDRSASPEQIMRKLGRQVRISPKLHVASGINSARSVFPLCRFDQTRCNDGILALESYQWAPMSASGNEPRGPLHNWASHGADAFRTAAVSMKAPPPAERKPDEDEFIERFGRYQKGPANLGEESWMY